MTRRRTSAGVGRLLPALLLALVVSGLCTVWLSRHLGKPAVAPNTPSGSLVVAAHDLSPGQQLQPGALKTVAWPSATQLPNAYSKAEQVQGRVLVLPLSAGEPVLAHHLAPAGSDGGLVARVPSGMRALSLRSDEIVGSMAFLKPGSSVDVVSAYRSGAGGFTSATVLQDVLVVAVGEQIDPDPQAKPNAAASGITLLVSPPDAERVILASSQGKLTVLLRNGADRGPTKGLQIRLSASGEAGGASPAEHRPTPGKPAPTKRQPRFIVETILGNKQTEQAFAGDAQ